MGDDRNMLNAGISVKLGRGDVYTRYSKVEMANQIKDLKEKNDKMQAENKEKYRLTAVFFIALPG